MKSDIQQLLSGTKISTEEWQAISIEKLELLDGEICGSVNIELLKLLIKNVGLVRTVGLFPREYWLKAIERSTA